MREQAAVLAPQFERLTKHTLVIERVAQSALNRQLEAEPFDVALVSLQTAGRLLERGKVTSDGVEFTVSGLPAWHPYFEYLFTGFMKGAMELVCANPVEATRLRRALTRAGG